MLDGLGAEEESRMGPLIAVPAGSWIDLIKFDTAAAGPAWGTNNEGMENISATLDPLYPARRPNRGAQSIIDDGAGVVLGSDDAVESGSSSDISIEETSREDETPSDVTDSDDPASEEHGATLDIVDVGATAGEEVAAAETRNGEAPGGISPKVTYSGPCRVHECGENYQPR